MKLVLIVDLILDLGLQLKNARPYLFERRNLEEISLPCFLNKIYLRSGYLFSTNCKLG